MSVDPRNWLGADEFIAWDAACILCDMEPFNASRDNPAPRNVQAMQTRIRRDLRPSRSTGTGGGFGIPQSYYSRTDLERFAAKLGLSFLNEAPSAGKDLRSDTRESLLIMVGILAEMYAEKAGPGLRNGERINQSALHRAISEYARDNKLKADLLSQSQFNERLKEALSLLR